MSSNSSLNVDLSKKTSFLDLKLWVSIEIGVGAFIVLIICILSMWVMFWRKSRIPLDSHPLSQIPSVSKDVKVDKVGLQSSQNHSERVFIPAHDCVGDKNSEKMVGHLVMSKSSDPDNIGQCSSIYHHERGLSSMSGEEGSSGTVKQQSALSYAGVVTASPLVSLPEFSHLGWGHWFMLRDLELATNRFSAENVLGEGGYGVVYCGRLINGTDVAVKKILNNLQGHFELYISLLTFGAGSMNPV